jgi:hypothetical protein
MAYTWCSRWLNKPKVQVSLGFEDEGFFADVLHGGMLTQKGAGGLRTSFHRVGEFIKVSRLELGSALSNLRFGGLALTTDAPY